MNGARCIPRTTLPARHTLPPSGGPREHHGNGRVEIFIYPAATERDRVAAALTLLAGTRWGAALAMTITEGSTS